MNNPEARYDTEKIKYVLKWLSGGSESIKREDAKPDTEKRLNALMDALNSGNGKDGAAFKNTGSY